MTFVVTFESMSEPLTETFARFAEDAELRRWNQRRTPGCRFVHVHQDTSAWKFTSEEWWRFVTRTIRNNGAYSLPSANEFQGHKEKTADVDHRDGSTRNVVLVRWTVDDWKNELATL